jgi:hypothetical protein
VSRCQRPQCGMTMTDVAQFAERLSAEFDRVHGIEPSPTPRTYRLVWTAVPGHAWPHKVRTCHGWDDLRAAIRILHDSCGVSYRRMRVEAA